MKCVNCGAEFTPKRSTAQFCGSSCRVQHARKKAAEDGDPSVEWNPEEKVQDLRDVAKTAVKLQAAPEFTKQYSEKPSLAADVLSRLTVKLPVSPAIIPRGTPILPPSKNK